MTTDYFAIDNKKRSSIKSLIEKYRKYQNERNIELHKISKKNNLMDIIIKGSTDDSFIDQCKNIDYMLKNKNWPSYLCKFNCNKGGLLCNKKWNYHDNNCQVSKILLTTCFIRHLICKNNLSLPNEIWEIICDYIESDIKIYIPGYFNCEDKIKICLKQEKCFNLRKIHIKKNDCKIDPINILKYINIGDIIIRGCSSYNGCYFSIILDIDVKNKLITLINDSNMEIHYIDIQGSKKCHYQKIGGYDDDDALHKIIIDLSNETTKIVNFYDFLSPNFDIKMIYVWNTNLRDHGF